MRAVPAAPIPRDPSPMPRLSIGFALAVVYVVWGSTYLAIAWTLETMPPFSMAGARFLLAGAILLAWRRSRGDPWPARIEWIGGIGTGLLLLLGGNGSVVWAQQRVPSGLAALVIGSVPAWMVLIDWLRPGGRRPTAMLAGGLALGFLGVGLLVAPRAGGSSVDPLGAAALVFGACSWATGSLLSRHVRMPSSPLLSTSIQMLGGGAGLCLAAAVAGEGPRIDVAAFSTKSWLALAYLVVFGSLIAFSCYAWLLRVTTPAVAATYAYVNPFVAVTLGALLAGERVTGSMVAAGALIVAGVVVITTRRPGPASPPRVADDRAA